MATGVRISDLFAATELDGADLFYVVNESAPRKLSVETLVNYLLTGPLFAKTVNAVAAENGNITLTKAHIGLSAVPNTTPVTSINTATGDISIVGGNDVDISLASNELVVAINPDLTIDFANITGSYSDNASLLAVLSSVGVQNEPRTITAESVSLALEIGDVGVAWVNVDYGVDVELSLGTIGTTNNLSVGAMIEIRQAGMGIVSVAASDGAVYISTPNGAWNTTDGPGTRIQLVYLGGDAWEYK